MTTKAVSLAESLFGDVETRNLFIKVEVDGQRISVSYEYDNKRSQPADFGSKKKLNGSVIAYAASVNKDKNLGPCFDAYIVDQSRVNKKGGYGNLLYYLTLHFAGDKGITADRILSSMEAVNSWNRLYADSEVVKKPLDDFYDPKTPPPEDDCNLASSGIYGDTTEEPESIKSRHAQSSYSWNASLADEKYRAIKGSKLNYVYVADSSDLIDYFTSINIPVAVNGKQPEFKDEPTLTLTSPESDISDFEKMFASYMKESHKPKKISLSSIIFNR
jgi:hypothetical protein